MKTIMAGYDACHTSLLIIRLQKGLTLKYLEPFEARFF
jgi:hypothetical protein